MNMNILLQAVAPSGALGLPGGWVYNIFILVIAGIFVWRVYVLLEEQGIVAEIAQRLRHGEESVADDTTETSRDIIEWHLRDDDHKKSYTLDREDPGTVGAGDSFDTTYIDDKGKDHPVTSDQIRITPSLGMTNGNIVTVHFSEKGFGDAFEQENVRLRKVISRMDMTMHGLESDLADESLSTETKIMQARAMLGAFYREKNPRGERIFDNKKKTDQADQEKKDQKMNDDSDNPGDWGDDDE